MSNPAPAAEYKHYLGNRPIRWTERRKDLILVGGGLILLLAVLAMVLSLAALSQSREAAPAAAVAAPAGGAGGGTPIAAAPSIDDADGVDYEEFELVDPNLPAVPAGKVKTFDVDVYHHVTQVDADLAPAEVWSYSVNGVDHRGTGYSEALVAEVGDVIDFKLTNGSSEQMQVTLPHSLDFHSAEVNPGERYADLMPGESMQYRFEANHPGVFMYHCATQPVLQHTGAGMVGAIIVKPKNLAPARDLLMVQQEYYIGEPGGLPDMDKMEAKQPDVIAFNGYADQYAENPITVKKGENVRIWLMNAGPSIWSAFHVIGTVFDKTVIEGVEGRHAQTVNLAPSQGGYVEFTLEEEGSYPFVTHAFGDMIKGALGVIQTENAPEAGHGSGH
ncbi:MAG TPA: multicopper oxidase domain-containing protein [Solirubrobacterales bacterium]|nr:multicopper oxidase domain-containing protein [Solirubrobacterales bacterium]